jgi:hypothetical protein
MPTNHARLLLRAALCALPVLAAAEAPAIARPPLPAGAIQWPLESLVWKPGAPGMPAGTRMLVLEGDPRADGLFTLRLAMPAGAHLAPHWHGQPERVTVLEGAVHVGFGSQRDASRMTEFRAGSYYVNPPLTPHYVDFPIAAVVQITTTGPWTLHFVEAQAAPAIAPPAADP